MGQAELVAEVKFTEWTCGGRNAPSGLPRLARGQKARRRGPGESSPVAQVSRSTPTKVRPLLVVDGDSFAHRAYHALPKSSAATRVRQGRRRLPRFANFLFEVLRGRKPWGCWCAGFGRRTDLPARSTAKLSIRARVRGRLVEQLADSAGVRSACGFADAKAAGYEADDFLAAAVAKEEERGGMAVVATGDRDAFQLASARTIILQPVKAGELARIGPGRGAAALWRGAAPGAGFHCAARRRVRSHSRRARRRTQDRRGPAAPPRLVGGLAQGWRL